MVSDTSDVFFDDWVSVADVQRGAGSTSNDNASFGTSELEQFDATLGVLTGVTLNLDSTLTPSVTVSSNAAGNGNNPVTSEGSGSATVAISAPGIDDTLSPAINASGSCSGRRRRACDSTTTEAGITASQTLAASGSLDSYVGNGTVAVDLTAPTLSASQLNDVFNGTERTRYDLNWAGTLSASYSYLLHAAPSFDGNSSIDSLVLDFGTVAQYSAVSPLGFSLFNLADPDRTALDLIGFTATGDNATLGSGLAQFIDLLQGSARLFYATLDTKTAGDFLATYILTLADAASIGAAGTRDSYTLTLTLKGSVTAISAVPVPDAVWLFASGLAGVFGVARRRAH